MAFTDNLMAMEQQQQQQPWMFRSTFADSWLSEAFARDTETLMTKTLQNSISNQYTDDFSSDVFNPFNQLEAATTTTTTATTQVQTQTSTVSGGGSESETAVSKKRKIAGGIDVNGEKVAKRRSRASKRVTTTYIAADPENFRQMVQQVTGVRFGGGDRRLPALPIHKPEPQRISNNTIMQTTSFLLPTLDTSAFLLDQVNNNPPMRSLDQALMAQPSAADSGPPSAQSQPDWLEGDGGSASTFDFDFFCTNFPILESNVI